ncbi:MAG: hydrolase [Syntrophomonadaceae bacterium]|nr:hydrolase [Syntrophomonadaceae bacterium]MDD3022647.1 hydrolase [Syntrophomonadaceae bacterium]
MSKYKLDRENTALIVIDLQERLMGAMKDREKVYKNTGILLDTVKQFNIPVIVSEQYPGGLGHTVNEIKEKLGDYHYIEKMDFSLCNVQGRQILKSVNKNTFIVTGSETHVCVFQTVRDLLQAGYNVHLVKDAVCSRSDDNYRNALGLMRDMGAVVSNTETVVFDLLQAAGTPQFKVISPLIK